MLVCCMHLRNQSRAGLGPASSISCVMTCSNEHENSPNWLHSSHIRHNKRSLVSSRPRLSSSWRRSEGLLSDIYRLSKVVIDRCCRCRHCRFLPTFSFSPPSGHLRRLCFPAMNDTGTSDVFVRLGQNSASSRASGRLVSPSEDSKQIDGA